MLRPSLLSSSSSSKPGRGPQQAPGAQRPPGPSLAPAPKPGSEVGVGCHLRAATRGLRCAAPGQTGRLPTGLGGSPAGAGRGARGLGVQSRRPRCGPTRPRGGAEPARGRLGDWLRLPPAPPAAAPEERGRGDPPPARSRPRARGIKGGRRAREPGPCSLRAPPAGRVHPPPTPPPLPARPSPGRYLQPSRELGDTAPPPPPPKSPKLRGCRPPGAGGKVRARGARAERATRRPSERTAVGGLSRAAAASQRCEWSARPTAG